MYTRIDPECESVMQHRPDSDKDTIFTFSHPKYLIKKIKCVRQTVEC